MDCPSAMESMVPENAAIVLTDNLDPFSGCRTRVTVAMQVRLATTVVGVHSEKFRIAHNTLFSAHLCSVVHAAVVLPFLKVQDFDAEHQLFLLQGIRQ